MRSILLLGCLLALAGCGADTASPPSSAALVARIEDTSAPFASIAFYKDNDIVVPHDVILPANDSTIILASGCYYLAAQRDAGDDGIITISVFIDESPQPIRQATGPFATAIFLHCF